MMRRRKDAQELVSTPASRSGTRTSRESGGQRRGTNRQTSPMGSSCRSRSCSSHASSSRTSVAYSMPCRSANPMDPTAPGSLVLEDTAGRGRAGRVAVKKSRFDEIRLTFGWQRECGLHLSCNGVWPSSMASLLVSTVAASGAMQRAQWGVSRSNREGAWARVR